MWKVTRRGPQKDTILKSRATLVTTFQFAFCDEIKAYLTGYVRSGDTYTANGATGLIKEIMAHLEEEGLDVTFRLESGYWRK